MIFFNAYFNSFMINKAIFRKTMSNCHILTKYSAKKIPITLFMTNPVILGPMN